MNTSEFVEIVRNSVCNKTVENLLSTLECPPGRQPASDLLSMSAWFRQLYDKQKQTVKEIVRLSVEDAIFIFLSILDGVISVENSKEKGSFELRFKKGDIEEVISPSKNFLYELFR